MWLHEVQVPRDRDALRALVEARCRNNVAAGQAVGSTGSLPNAVVRSQAQASEWASRICAQLSARGCAILLSDLVHGTLTPVKDLDKPLMHPDEGGGARVCLLPRSEQENVPTYRAQVPQAVLMVEEALDKLLSGEMSKAKADRYVKVSNHLASLMLKVRVPRELWFSGLLLDALRHMIIYKLHGYTVVKGKQRPDTLMNVDCYHWRIYLWGFLDGWVVGLQPRRVVVESYHSTHHCAVLGSPTSENGGLTPADAVTGVVVDIFAPVLPVDGEMFCEASDEIVGTGYHTYLSRTTADPPGGGTNPQATSEIPAAVTKQAFPIARHPLASSTSLNTAAAALCTHMLTIFPEQNHLISKVPPGSVFCDSAECILWCILAAIGQQLPPGIIPSAAQLKDCQPAGTALKPGVQEYVARWNSLYPAQRVQATEVYAVLSLVWKMPVTAEHAAPLAGPATGAVSASNDTVAWKLDGLISCLQRCKGDLTTGMRNFGNALTEETAKRGAAAAGRGAAGK